MTTGMATEILENGKGLSRVQNTFKESSESSSPPSFTIEPVRTEQDLALTISLFTLYAQSLNIDLSFQDFQTEMASMPGKYSPSENGELLLARARPRSTSLNAVTEADDTTQGEALGCVALRALHSDINGPCEKVCEMKRLYVSPSARGLGLGRALAEQIIALAVSLGYKEMRLDTLPTMQAAQGMYKDMGFVDIRPYCVNPIEGTRFLGLNMKQSENAD